MSVARVLSDLRIKKNKSLQDVADAIGVSKTHLWELEKGRADNPSLETIKRLADYFSVPISVFVGEQLESDSDPQQLAVMFRQVRELGQNERDILSDMLISLQKRSKSNGD